MRPELGAKQKYFFPVLDIETNWVILKRTCAQEETELVRLLSYYVGGTAEVDVFSPLPPLLFAAVAERKGERGCWMRQKILVAGEKGKGLGMDVGYI